MDATGKKVKEGNAARDGRAGLMQRQVLVLEITYDPDDVPAGEKPIDPPSTWDWTSLADVGETRVIAAGAVEMVVSD